MAQYSAEPAQSSQRPRQSPELGLLATLLAWLAALRELAAPLLGCPHGHAIALGGLGDAGNAPHLRVPDAHVGVRSWGAAHHPLTTGRDTWLAGADGNHVSDLVTMDPGRPHPGAIGPTPPNATGSPTTRRGGYEHTTDAEKASLYNIERHSRSTRGCDRKLSC